MYDLIIVGSGPAGMTAGIYAARREMKTLIIGKELGGQVVWASEIENYPGLPKIQSFELIQAMKKQVEGFGVKIETDEVKEIIKKGEFFQIITNKRVFESKTVILALGLSPRRLAISGEKEFNGRGVTYCANCDGPLYRDKQIVVVGGGNSALDAAEMMSKIAKKVYLVHRREEFRAFEALVAEVKARENIEMILNAEIKEIRGGDRVESVLIAKKGEEDFEILSDGVFIEIGRIASTDLVSGLADRNERDEIVVDEYCQTKTPGLYAAGDVTQIPFKQISSANGQATIAALAAYQFLQLKQGKNVGIVFDRSIKK